MINLDDVKQMAEMIIDDVYLFFEYTNPSKSELILVIGDMEVNQQDIINALSKMKEDLKTDLLNYSETIKSIDNYLNRLKG